MVTVILLSTFIVSVIALIFFMVALVKGLFGPDANGATVIFAKNEIGTTDDPAASPEAREALQAAVPDAAAHPQDADELAARAAADASSRTVTFIFMCCAIVWMLVASAAGLVASI